MATSLLNHLKKMISLGKEIVVNGPRLIEEVGSINAKGDKTIGMDVKVEQALIKYIKDNNIPANIFSEEIGEIKFHQNPKYLIAFDPLDGSSNYKIGKNIFPFGLLIAIYKGAKPKLKDVVAAGAIEYSRDFSWFFSEGKTIDSSNQKIELKKDWPANKSTPVFLDLYYKEGYELYRSLAQKVFIRNIGSTVGNLSYVLSNIAAGLGGVCMRPEEIGCVYSLIKGAGGKVVDHNGNDLGNLFFSPQATYQILAGAENIIDFLVSGLKKPAAN